MDFIALLKAIFTVMRILIGFILFFILEILFPFTVLIAGIIALIYSFYNYYK